MSQWTGAILLLLVGASLCFSQNVHDDSPIEVTYKDLVANPDGYLQTTIRFRGTYGYGFEWMFLCDPFCKVTPVRIWVNFGDLCSGSQKKLKRGSDNFDNRADVVFVGRLERGTFGDGGYPYQMTVSCVEEFKKLPSPTSFPRRN